MKTIINGKEYLHTNEVRDNSNLRDSFNELAKKTFGINFEGWYQNGFWGDNYIPYVLMDGNIVAANVSISIMHTIYKNERRMFIQIGTVMTDERYRSQGLSRWLIEKILTEWKDKCDGIYLYANDRVLNFYPKFGFVTEEEYQAFGTVTYKKAEIKRLDINSEMDKRLLYEKYALTNQFSELTLDGNIGILMFYCSEFMKDNIYYLPQYDLVVIAEYDADKLICYDVFGRTNVALHEILAVMARKDTKVSILGFTPKDKEKFSFKKVKMDDTTLFLLSGKENIFSHDSRLMFPLLSHA
jgi:predicted GNAT family N-acyltransferase